MFQLLMPPLLISKVGLLSMFISCSSLNKILIMKLLGSQPSKRQLIWPSIQGCWKTRDLPSKDTFLAFHQSKGERGEASLIILYSFTYFLIKMSKSKLDGMVPMITEKVDLKHEFLIFILFKLMLTIVFFHLNYMSRLVLMGIDTTPDFVFFFH